MINVVFGMIRSIFAVYYSPVTLFVPLILGVLASQTRHDYCPQSSMIREVMSPGLVGRW
jgi:formate transporter